MKNLYFEVKDHEIECVKRTVTDGCSDTRVCCIFSKEWNGYNKVAKFTRGDIEFEPQLLDDDSCYIPKDAVDAGWFRMAIIGAKMDDNVQSYLETETIIVYI